MFGAPAPDAADALAAALVALWVMLTVQAGWAQPVAETEESNRSILTVTRIEVTAFGGLQGGGTYLALPPTEDPTRTFDTAADGDDNNNTDDEDGLVDPAGDLDLLVGETPTVDVQVTNNTGTAATLYGWIDYNGDGVFDSTPH